MASSTSVVITAMDILVPQVQPNQGLNPLSPDHDSTWSSLDHVPEMPVYNHSIMHQSLWKGKCMLFLKFLLCKIAPCPK